MSGEEGSGAGRGGGAEWRSCPPCTFPIALREQIAEGQRGQNGLCNCKLVRKFKIFPPSFTPDTVRSPGQSCAAPGRLPGLGKGRERDGATSDGRLGWGQGLPSALGTTHCDPSPRLSLLLARRGLVPSRDLSPVCIFSQPRPLREGTSRESHAFRLDRAPAGAAAALSPSTLRSAGPARATRGPGRLAPDNPMGEQRAGVQSAELGGAVSTAASPRPQCHCTGIRRQCRPAAANAYSVAA